MFQRNKDSFAIAIKLVQNLKLITITSFLIINILLSIASANEKQLTLIYAGNMPDIGTSTFGTYSKLASLLKANRAENSPTIFAFAGGSLGPSPLSSLDKGTHIIDILNTLEPDLMTLTKREFSYSEDELILRSYEAAFPIVSSNIYDPASQKNLEGVSSIYIAEKEDIKVGFISVLDEEVVEEYLLSRIQVLEPKEIIQQQIAYLKQRKVDLIILTYAKDRDYYHTLISEKQIDFALRVLPTAEQNKQTEPPQNVYAIATNAPFIALKIRWDAHSSDKNLTIDIPKLNRSTLARDQATSQLIDEYNQRLNRLLNQQIGVWGTQIDTSRSLVRTQEIAFGNLVADSIKSYMNTEIALINAGDIRGDRRYTKGSPITRRDIITEIPFRNTVTKINITGAQLKEALEHSVSELDQIKGRFLQVSGLSFTYTLEKPPYNRVVSILVNQEPLVATKTYSLAISNYLAKGGDGYDVFMHNANQNNNAHKSPLISDIVTRTIQHMQYISPSVENRIVQDKQ
ncbi:bifunctional metallophosphatase/5'-nucleotidase [Paraglaciecola sp. 2405UD69-4]|uniref:bifunctional metallophosphatase/5'-nucleotidase n=1 Tax=Paraglaciecola sp. 2405UD69-4 TaxID=3391836 RepID=UPI0039C93875